MLSLLATAVRVHTPSTWHPLLLSLACNEPSFFTGFPRTTLHVIRFRPYTSFHFPPGRKVQKTAAAAARLKEVCGLRALGLHPPLSKHAHDGANVCSKCTSESDGSVRLLFPTGHGSREQAAAVQAASR